MDPDGQVVFYMLRDSYVQYQVTVTATGEDIFVKRTPARRYMVFVQHTVLVPLVIPVMCTCNQVAMKAKEATNTSLNQPGTPEVLKRLA
jgi:hypothetical protein